MLKVVAALALAALVGTALAAPRHFNAVAVWATGVYFLAVGGAAVCNRRKTA